MRKDLRVGLGIGLVLLAVLVVAMVVKSRNRHNTAQAFKTNAPEKTDGGENPIPPVDPTAGPETRDPTPGAPTPLPPTQGTTDSPKPEKHDIFDNTDKPDTWDKLLLTGTLPTDSRLTTTPPRAGDRPGSPAEHTMTPGSLPGGGTSVESGGPTAPPVRPATPVAGGARTHKIAQGETYSTIARTVYGNKKFYLDIEKANPGVDPTRLHAGQVIKLPDIPAAERTERHATRGGAGAPAREASAAVPASAVDSRREYVVKSGDSLYRISTTLYGNASKVDSLYDLNKDRIGPDRERLKLGMKLKLPAPPTSNAR